MRPVLATGAALVCLLGAATGRARAEAPARVVNAIASSTDGSEETTGVARLFDGDDATAWCARKKVKVRVTLRLDRPERLTRLSLTLGAPGDWQATPRVKQVLVSVVDGDRLLKKVRHKWPDGEARSGEVNLGAVGDAVIVEFDQVYAGSSPRGLCIGSMSLRGGAPGEEQAVDVAPLAARALGEAGLAARLEGVYVITVPVGEAGEVRHGVRLDAKGKLEYRDDGGLVVHGSWKLAAAGDGSGLELVLELKKARRGKQAVAVAKPMARLVVPWRFAPAADGEAPRPLPWFALGVDDAGALALREPRQVIAP